MRNKQKINQEVIKTQKDVDVIVPGLVKISAIYCEDRRCHILIGSFDDPRSEFGSSYSEDMDRYYTDNKLFLGYFKQRQAYMMASKEEQLAFDDHPAFFKA